MNEQLISSANKAYEKANENAKNYYRLLELDILEKNYEKDLIRDLNLWKKSHVDKNYSISKFICKNVDISKKKYHEYLNSLEKNGKLDEYLRRSISYIFMRDLGKSLEDSETRERIEKTISNYKSLRGGEDEKTSIKGIYLEAKKNGVEGTLIWLLNKLKEVSNNLPTGVDKDNSIRKIIKIILGVIVNQFDNAGKELSYEERRDKIDAGIRLGYAYGITYPFVDDLLDAKVLSKEEEDIYSNLIYQTLISGTVSRMKEWNGENKKLMLYVYSELKESFEYIRNYHNKENLNTFLNKSYVFFNSQEIDRKKSLENKNYTNEEIYIPVILKSASSRQIVKSVIDADNEIFEKQMFFYGIYNQLSDDFTDMFEDKENGRVTPYTYYIKYKDVRKDLINPFELYFVVIHHLIHNIYKEHKESTDIILNRMINGLKRCKERVGREKYNEIMEQIRFGGTEFNLLLQNMVDKGKDVDFLDKLVRDYMLDTFKTGKIEKENFKNTIEEVKEKINKALEIKGEEISLLKENIIDAANYSVNGGGKRLRPIITWNMATETYGLKEKDIMPLLKSLEYMHTASLILDDLPSQDNSQFRRGKETLHKVYGVSTAELTSLYLTQQAVYEQSIIKGFSGEIIIELIRYSSEIVKKMCLGQAMDLDSKNKKLDVEQLKTMCFYKTGIAFEAAVIMPAILAKASEEEKKALMDFSKYAGIAFQIKDDMLDFKGDSKLLGKDSKKDIENECSTFVSVLGYEEAEKQLWEHYVFALDSLKLINKNTKFLSQMMDYILNRDH